MDIIAITPEQLEIVIQNAIIEALNIKLNAPGLPERCTFKEALEIAGLSKSLLYQKTMNKSIPFGNRLIFSRKELKEWVETNTLSKPKKQTLLKLTILKAG